MPYFPDLNCSNTIPEEDNRILDLPNLKELRLINIRLSKVPDLSLMPQLEIIWLTQNKITAEMRLRNNAKLWSINLHRSELTVPPDLSGGCKELIFINLNGIKFRSFPRNFFLNCKKLLSLSYLYNRLDAFPYFGDAANSINVIGFEGAGLPGMITNEMVKDLRNVTRLILASNNLQGFDGSFCQGRNPVYINVKKKCKPGCIWKPLSLLCPPPWYFCHKTRDASVRNQSSMWPTSMLDEEICLEVHFWHQLNLPRWKKMVHSHISRCLHRRSVVLNTDILKEVNSLPRPSSLPS